MTSLLPHGSWSISFNWLDPWMDALHASFLTCAHPRHGGLTQVHGIPAELPIRHLPTRWHRPASTFTMSTLLTGVVRCDVASSPRNSSLPLHSKLAGLAPVVACRRHGPPTASEKWRMSRRRHAYTLRPQSVAADTSQASLSESAIRTETWTWRGHRIRYLVAGRRGDSSSPALLLVHGFGSNADHWRKIMEVQAGDRQVYAIDLLGAWVGWVREVGGWWFNQDFVLGSAGDAGASWAKARTIFSHVSNIGCQ